MSRNPFDQSNAPFEASCDRHIRTVQGNASAQERQMQNDEAGLIVVTGGGLVSTVFLPNPVCVRVLPIVVHADGADAVNVAPLAGQRMNGVTDGTRTVPGGQGRSFYPDRDDGGWYST